MNYTEPNKLIYDNSLIENQSQNIRGSPLRNKPAAVYRFNKNSKKNISHVKEDSATLSKQLLNFKQYMINLPSLQNLISNHPFAKPQNADFGNFKYQSWFEMVSSLEAVGPNRKISIIDKNASTPQIPNKMNFG